MTRRAALLLALAGCGAPEAPPVVRPHVVLVTLDTVRADRVGAYGYELARTDAIDALAASGRRYERAYAPIPLTIPSHAAIFSGIWPARLGIRDNGDAVLGQEVVTLAEVLSGAGYDTAASVAAFVTTARWGFGQGFGDYYDDVPLPRERNFWHASRPGAEVVDDLIAWRSARASGAPQFVWAHLYDAHFPYTPAEPWSAGSPGRPYDAEIAYVDDQVARLVEAWSGEPTLFVVVADHGEGLGEHGELTHGLFVYDATQRVPFIMAGPGISPEVVSEPVSLVDLLPTVLDHLGLPIPDGVDGRVAPGTPARPIYMEAWQLRERFGVAPHVAVVHGDDKLIDVTRPELYDVRADPGERRDRGPAEQARVAELQRALASFGFGAPAHDAGEGLDPDVAAQLAALGYTGGGFVGGLEGPLPDPKDHERLIGLAQRAQRLQQEDRLDDAEQVLATLIAEHPDVIELRSRRAMVLSRLGRDAEALDALQQTLALAPDDPGLQFAMAGQLARTGRFREASAMYQGLAAHMTYSPRVRVLAVASLRSAPGGADDALELGLGYLADHPDDRAVAGLVGVELARRRRGAEARPWLEVGGQAAHPEPEVLFTLAGMAHGRGDVADAERLLRAELDAYPANRKAGGMLLGLLGAGGRWEEQVELADRMLANGASDVRLLHAKAQALFNVERYAQARESLAAGLAVAPDAAALLLLDANLLMKEGDPEAGTRRFEQAQRAREREAGAAP